MQNLDISPLEALAAQVPPETTRAFLAASAITRRALEEDPDAITLIRQRGATPHFWAADGLADFEPPAVTAQPLELPLGTYWAPKISGIGIRVPNESEKEQIIATALDTAIEERGSLEHVRLVDEVDRGDTAVSMVAHTIRRLRSRGIDAPITLIAAEAAKPDPDHRHINAYRRIVAGEVPGVTATTTSMPLVREGLPFLLDTVRVETSALEGGETVRRFVTERNVRAEILVRGLGSMSRDPEVAHDPEAHKRIVESQGIESEETKVQVMRWLKEVVV